jgi:hypothetical protein
MPPSSIDAIAQAERALERSKLEKRRPAYAAFAKPGTRTCRVFAGARAKRRRYVVSGVRHGYDQGVRAVNAIERLLPALERCGGPAQYDHTRR